MRIGRGTRVGHGLRIGISSTLLTGPVSMFGYSLGEGLAGGGRIQAVYGLFGSSLGEGLAGDSRVQVVWNMRGVSLGEGLAFSSLAGILSMFGSSLGEGLADGRLQWIGQLRGYSLGEGLAGALFSGIFPLYGYSLGEGLSQGTVLIAQIYPEDAYFYWDSMRGVQQTIGGRIRFARASAANGVNSDGLEYTALPNTPVYDWADLDGVGFSRPLLWLRPARTVDSVSYAVDQAYWETQIPPVGLGAYVRCKIDVNTDNTRLLEIANAAGNSPVVRIWQQFNGKIWGLVHNGAQRVDLLVTVPNLSPGDVIEALLVFEDGGQTSLIVARNGTLIGSSSGATPAMPAGWAGGGLVVLNGYNAAPSSARYSDVRIVKEGAFAKQGTGRLTEIRDFYLTPQGDTIPTKL